MINYVTKQKITILCLMMAVVILMGVVAIQLTKIDTLESIPAASVAAEIEVFTGEFTLFHYTQGGWVNYYYITEFYIEGQILHYKIGDSRQSIPVLFQEIGIVQGWIEEENLPKYGYWIPDDLGL